VTAGLHEAVQHAHRRRGIYDASSKRIR
jgi:hypothetical protein